MVHASAALRNSAWDTRILDVFREAELPAPLEDIVEEERRRGLDAVVIDIWPNQKEPAEKLIASLNGAVSVAVGPAVTASPEAFSNGPFTHAIAGEYDEALPALLNGEKQVPGLSTPGETLSLAVPTDLDALPFPDIEIRNYRVQSSAAPLFGRKRWWFVLSSRGCPRRCAYCSPATRRTIGTAVRTRNPEAVAEEIRMVERERGVNAVFFADDNFNHRPERVSELCGALRRAGVRSRWLAQCHPVPLSAEILGEMKRAGCFGVTMGIESGSERDLAALNRGVNVDEIRRAGLAVRRAGLSLTVFLMLGIPGQTREDLDSTLGLLEELKPLMIQVAYFTPYPGNSLLPTAGISWESLEKYNCDPLNLSRMSDLDLRRAQRQLYSSYYLTAGYALRYLRHRLPYSFGAGESSLLRETAEFFLKRPAP